MKKVFVVSIMALFVTIIGCRDDQDKEIEENELCNPNPCLKIRWSDGNCYENGKIFSCGCEENNEWDGKKCEGKIRTTECLGLPENAVWNSVSEIAQKWTDNSYWDPSENGIYSKIESDNHCRFKCAEKHEWIDSVCEKRWETVATGSGHVCAIRNEGELYCWGWNWGRLGNGLEESQNRPVRILLDPEKEYLKDGQWKSISAGVSHTCGIVGDGELYCWGENEYGQVGDGTNEDQYLPARIAKEENVKFKEVHTRYEHSCAIDLNGNLYCWGKNYDGQVGDETKDDRNIPVEVNKEYSPWIDVSTGNSHTCALNGEGYIYCWGRNARGQFGDGTENHSLTPVRAGDDNDWIGVEAGGAHTCALKNNGVLFCWGSNDRGELGVGTKCEQDEDYFCDDRFTPTEVISSYDTQGDEWISFSVGYENTGAIKRDGSLYCWGRDWKGFLGDGSYDDSESPSQIGDDKWSQVSMGGFWNTSQFTCVIKETGDLYCWGVNSFGQLGNGTTKDSTTPILVDTSDIKHQ